MEGMHVTSAPRHATLIRTECVAKQTAHNMVKDSGGQTQWNWIKMDRQNKLRSVGLNSDPDQLLKTIWSTDTDMASVMEVSNRFLPIIPLMSNEIEKTLLFLPAGQGFIFVARKRPVHTIQRQWYDKGTNKRKPRTFIPEKGALFFRCVTTPPGGAGCSLDDRQEVKNNYLVWVLIKR